MLFTINTGLITSICAILTFTTVGIFLFRLMIGSDILLSLWHSRTIYITWRSTFWEVVVRLFYFALLFNTLISSLPKVYTNSILATLNSRQKYRTEGAKETWVSLGAIASKELQNTNVRLLH
jgi:hypothetical protein